MIGINKLMRSGSILGWEKNTYINILKRMLFSPYLPTLRITKIMLTCVSDSGNSVFVLWENSATHSCGGWCPLYRSETMQVIPRTKQRSNSVAQR